MVNRRDIEAMIGVLAVTEGHLLAGHMDDRTWAKLATHLVESGAMESRPDARPLSAGLVARAMDALILRLRFALGEYDSNSDRTPEATAHVMRFPTEAQAVSCMNDLRDSATDVYLEPDPDTDEVLLYAVYAELMPDSGFLSREQELMRVAQLHAGTYTGSQGAPASRNDLPD